MALLPTPYAPSITTLCDDEVMGSRTQPYLTRTSYFGCGAEAPLLLYRAALLLGLGLLTRMSPLWWDSLYKRVIGWRSCVIDGPALVLALVIAAAALARWSGESDEGMLLTRSRGSPLLPLFVDSLTDSRECALLLLCDVVRLW